MLTDEQFAAEFQSFSRSVFRVDRTAHPLGREEEAFQRYLAGSLTPPTEYGWLRPWLAQLAQWRDNGKTFIRVRVLAEPPTDYQRWLLWGTPWMCEAGEVIQYISGPTAVQIGLPDQEWCLFDDTRLIEMDSRRLITDPAVVAAYCEMRDAALQNSMTAETVSF